MRSWLRRMAADPLPELELHFVTHLPRAAPLRAVKRVPGFPSWYSGCGWCCPKWATSCCSAHSSSRSSVVGVALFSALYNRCALPGYDRFDRYALPPDQAAFDTGVA